MSAFAEVAARWGGHVWTVMPTLGDLLWRAPGTAARDESIAVVDDRFGPTVLSCSFVAPPGARDLVVLVHGLGGNRRSGYVCRAARALQRRGFATLAVDLRGADRRGGGFYHAALTEDLAAVCASPLLRPFARLFVLGFSLGGHVAIWFAASGAEPRLRGVAALGTPLDLHAAQQFLDAPGRAFYRRWVLRGLKDIYDAVAARHAVPVPAAAVRRCRTFREWDALTIAPRYGFASPEEYYTACSAAHALPRLRTDTVLVLAQHDPIVPPQLAVPFVDRAPAGRLHVCVLPRGGHLSFPRASELGLGRAHERGVVPQLAAYWRS